MTKEALAHEGVLLPYTNKSPALAAIDYIVSLSSDYFLPSHDGNVAKAMRVKIHKIWIFSSEIIIVGLYSYTLFLSHGNRVYVWQIYNA